MILIKTWSGLRLELPADTKMYQNEFGVWFWDDFHNISAQKANKDYEYYSKIFCDYVAETKNISKQNKG